MKYDYLIVGSGLFGSVCARELSDAGFTCLVIEKRAHIGGNVYTEKVDDIDIHKYGAHIFHTNDSKIWAYVNKFSEFNNYRHKVLVNNNNKIFSFPINLMTLFQVWNITNPEDAKIKLKSFKENNAPKNIDLNLESWIVSQIGLELYEIFVKGYTTKQWGREPNTLPASIIKRIPIRTNFNDFYFDDNFQGIPKDGYTKLVSNLLHGVEVKINTDFFDDVNFFSNIAKKIIYTGPIDRLLNFRHGNLEYRSLNFEHQNLEISDFQGVAVMNYTDSMVPFTRILEHKHFNLKNQKNTIITKEYPLEWDKSKEPYYPVNDEKNQKIYLKYEKEIEKTMPNFVLGGRLAEYKYYDMHQVVASALSKVKKLIENHKST